MSSITITSKKTIVLFQGGLGDTGGGFQETINRLSNRSSKMIDSNVLIDMKSFKVERNEFYGLDTSGYLTKQSSLSMEFNQKIADIITLANNNTNKSILVRTSLSESIGYISKGKIDYLGFDSIKNQAKKLVYIINAIKNADSSVRIILVGHSQGGLVNLDAATQVPYKIEKMVSISTPYSPVYMAKKLMHINFLASLIKMDVYSMIESDSRMAKRYQTSVEDLGNSEFFDDVKKRWNNLSNRPSLFVVAGVSGHLSTYTPGFSDPLSGFYNPDTIAKYSFDGLVSASEQTAIDYASIVGLSDPNLGCYNNKEFLKSPCYFQQGFYMSCKRGCSLSSFNLNNTLLLLGIDALKKTIDGWIKDTKYDFRLNDFDIIQDIYNGVSGDPISNTKNQNYYNVYKSDYSHQNLRYCDETIGFLIPFFSF